MSSKVEVLILGRGQNGHSMFMHIMCKLFTSANTEYKLTSLYSSKRFNNSMKERRKKYFKTYRSIIHHKIS